MFCILSWILDFFNGYSLFCKKLTKQCSKEYMKHFIFIFINHNKVKNTYLLKHIWWCRPFTPDIKNEKKERGSEWARVHCLLLFISVSLQVNIHVQTYILFLDAYIYSILVFWNLNYMWIIIIWIKAYHPTEKLYGVRSGFCYCFHHTTVKVDKLDKS